MKVSIKCGASALFFVFSIVLSAMSASAADLLLVDINNINFNYRSASNPVLQSVMFNAPVNTRSGYSRTAPFLLPCDVNYFAIGLRITNISNITLYPTMRGQVMPDGLEKRLLPNVWGVPDQQWPTNFALQPGQTFNPAYIFFAANTRLVNYSPNVFAPNVPTKIAMISFPQLNASYQAPAQEDVIWNNAYTLWVMRDCPAGPVLTD